ncbi:hypothetical protein A2U01_0075642, partial [Trifolium medium]|nr:hypothetical protein [Trifolium medium]
KLEKASLEAEVKKVQETCDFFQENHPNGYCIPEGMLEEEQVKYMGRPNSYSG